MSNNIPIGTRFGPDFPTIKVRFRKGIKVKLGDIVTLDMIEPYESEAVRKVASYISGFTTSLQYSNNNMEDWIEHAREIVKLVHEAEDADE